MNIKKILGLELRIITIGYIMFALVYGWIISSVNLATTIKFESVAAAEAARRTQLFAGIPYVILGFVLLAVIIIYYLSRHLQSNITSTLAYGIVVTCVGAVLAASFIAIEIYIKSPMFLAIVPTFFLLLYGILSIISCKRNIAKVPLNADL